MKRRDRIINSLNHKKSDIIPFHADFTLQEFDRMVDYTGDVNFVAKLNNHLNPVSYVGWPTEIEYLKGHFKDDFGVCWNRTGADKDIGVIDSPVIAEADISLWKEPVFDEARFRKELQSTLDNAEDKFSFAGIGFSMFERAWSLCGMENLLIYMITDPEFVHQLLDKICEYNCKIIDIANEYPFDGFYFGDDWGQQKGLITGPKLWREFIKPRMRTMYSKVKSSGRYVLQHSCGDIEELFPDLIEIGLDCYQTFQPEIYDIVKIKNEYGNDLTFWGAISTQRLLPYATAEQVKIETARIMKIMGRNGGYIAAPTHAVPGDVPPENIAAMFEVFNNQDKFLSN